MAGEAHRDPAGEDRPAPGGVMALEFLFAGFAVFWAGIFVYLLMLQARLRNLQREIDRLEERLTESDAQRGAKRA
ncbi:MAG: CcmD family protein [Chloroflexi bacterium]|nr:MAG: CcmD family protein [Chloroflexota bacterium]